MIQFRGFACIVGSCRFSKLYREANRELTLRGWIVLDAGCYVHDEVDPEIIGRLIGAHKDVAELYHLKIALASIVVLVAGPYGGQELYFGEDTRRGLEFARSLNKQVVYWHELGGDFDKLARIGA